MIRRTTCCPVAKCKITKGHFFDAFLVNFYLIWFSFFHRNHKNFTRAVFCINWWKHFYLSWLSCFHRNQKAAIHQIWECELVAIRQLGTRTKKLELATLFLIDRIRKREPASSIWIYGIENWISLAPACNLNARNFKRKQFLS